MYASGKFFAKLLTIPNWHDMTLTDAAQTVQRSAYPDAYAKWCCAFDSPRSVGWVRTEQCHTG